ncbi:hypothetical protein AgCh_006712 [Apium graveolens]
MVIGHGIHSVASFSAKSGFHFASPGRRARSTRLFSLSPGLSLRFVLFLYRRLNEDTRPARLSQMPATGPSSFSFRVWIFRVVSAGTHSYKRPRLETRFASETTFRKRRARARSRTIEIKVFQMSFTVFCAVTAVASGISNLALSWSSPTPLLAEAEHLGEGIPPSLGLLEPEVEHEDEDARLECLDAQSAYASSLSIGFPSFAVSGEGDKGEAPNMFYPQPPSGARTPIVWKIS